MARDAWAERSVEEIKSPSPNALATGPFGSAISSRYFVDHGVPVIRGGNLSQNVDVRLNDDGLVFLTEEKAREFSRSLARRGDLIFTCWGTIDQVGLVDDRSRFREYVVSNKQMKLTPDPQKANSLFLYYLFSSPIMRDRILNQGIGSSVPGFNLGQLRSLSLNLPPLQEQGAIAQILGALDDKIELNRRMNETLEAMSRALFKSWFVDFDPVWAKAAGRAYGLPKHLAGLFPDRLVDSELGQIPEGWGVGRLDSVLVLQRGFDLPATQRTSGAYSVLAASGPSGTHNEFMVRGPGVTTGRSGVLGKVFYVDDDFWPLNTSLWVKEFRHSRPAYAFHLLRGLDFASFNAGSAVPTLNRNHVHHLSTLLPPMGLVDAFEQVATASFRRQKHNDHQSTTLAALRDTLLPKLISGELRVAQPKALAEAMQ